MVGYPISNQAITDLDLNVEIYPCPWGATRTRAVMQQLGGKQQFPFLVDPNTDKAMYESADIVDYLYAQYGALPLPTRKSPLQLCWCVRVAEEEDLGVAAQARGRPRTRICYPAHSSQGGCHLCCASVAGS